MKRKMIDKPKTHYVPAISVTLVGMITLLVTASPVFAHHILGIPHYAYDERYPQTPVLTYRMNAGSYEVRMTGYPGKPQPGEPCSLHLYIRKPDEGKPFDGIVRLSVMKDTMIGTDPVIYGPVDAEQDEALYKFYPLFQDEGNYITRIEFEAEGASWIIDLPMVAGEPGSPWVVLGSIGAGIALFLLVIRAIRIKMRRKAGLVAVGVES